MARSRATGRAKKQHSTAKNAKTAIVCSVCGKGDGKYKCPKCRSPFCCVQCSKDHKANHCPATKSVESGHDDVSKQQSNTSLAATTTTTTTAAAINTTSNEPQSKYLPAAAFAQASSSSSSSSQPKKKRMRRSNDDDDDSDNDEPGWNITEEMKQMIQHSEWIRKELEDGGLRHLIEQIDAASDVEEDDDDSNNRRKNWGRNTNKNGNSDISQRVLALARTKHSHPKFATFIDRLLLTAGVLTDGGGGGGEANLFEEGEVGRLELVPVPRRGGGESVAAAAVAGKEEESSSEEEDSDSGSDSDDSDGSSAEE